MAKKAARKSGVNKSELVRAYMKDNPTAKPREVAEAVTKQSGVEISPNYVSVVKQNMKAKGKKAGGKVQKRGLVIEKRLDFEAAKAFIDAHGGSLETAQECLRMVADLLTTVHR